MPGSKTKQCTAQVAESKYELEQRMTEFLWNNPSVPNVRLRRVLDEHFLTFNRVAIFGGMVRDFACAERKSFHSDVDLVIEDDAEAVARFARKHGAKANRYGGYAFHAEGWEFDFWALETTWASRSGHVDVREIEDLVDTTFFCCDAVLYDLKKRAVVCHDRYLDHLRSGQLEINLEPNPSVAGNLYRAVRRMLLWELAPGPKLRAFIDRHLSDEMFEELLQRNARKHGDEMIASFEGAGRLRRALLSRTQR